MAGDGLEVAAEERTAGDRSGRESRRHRWGHHAPGVVKGDRAGS